MADASPVAMQSAPASAFANVEFTFVTHLPTFPDAGGTPFWTCFARSVRRHFASFAAALSFAAPQVLIAGDGGARAATSDPANVSTLSSICAPSADVGHGGFASAFVTLVESVSWHFCVLAVSGIPPIATAFASTPRRHAASFPAALTFAAAQAFGEVMPVGKVNCDRKSHARCATANPSLLT